jgi:hypothetical protein
MTALSQQQTAPNCAPACAECGRLECLCRPRFFAGQLLTEQDLNRLDAYIRGKNRLHTLQLNGFGVVNGLDVRCEPCGTGVVVGIGYAISPCGDDIVVCRDTSVDVCALVKKCQPVDNTCQPYQDPSARGCEDLVEPWVLAIRYAEAPARGVTSLRMSPSCSCGASPGTCSCGFNSASCGYPAKGGSCSCGKPAGQCTCGTPTTTTTKPRTAVAECEPTVICEGYSFDVFPVPKTKDKPPEVQLTGALWERFMCCLKPLADVIPSMPIGDPNAKKQEWNLWCCRTRQLLINYFLNGPASNCTIAEKLSILSCPGPNSVNFEAERGAAVTALVDALLEALLECLCYALLPPAPCGTSEDRIPLAVVQVRKRDCKVLSVCNFTPFRKMVLSAPALEYWLSWIPWSSLCNLIHNLCCRAIVPLGTTREQPAPGVPSRAAVAETAPPPSGDESVQMLNPTLSPDAIAQNQTFAAILKSAMARAPAPIDPNDVIGGLFGLDLGGKQPLSAEERTNPPQFLLLNEVVRPLAANLLGPSTLGTLVATSKAAAETEALKARISALEQTIKTRQRKR